VISVSGGVVSCGGNACGGFGNGGGVGGGIGRKLQLTKNEIGRIRHKIRINSIVDLVDILF